MRLRTLSFALAVVLGGTLLAPACQKKEEAAPPPAAAEPPVAAEAPAPAPVPEVALAAVAPVGEAPLGIPDLPASTDNPSTPEKVFLGKQLFFDKRLSEDGSASCETCHVQTKGWTDGKELSTKVGGALNTRHTPTLYNTGNLRSWYWDGRAPSLEKQIAAAWKGQMGADPEKIARALGTLPEYRARFQQVFGAAPTADSVPQALAAYVRTLRSGDSPWDRYEKGDAKAVSADAIAGQKVFMKAACAACHTPPLYTDSMFHNVGVGSDAATPDVGRFKVSNDAKDTGAFKTPGLRSVAKSGPYFHDGKVATLEEAVRFMVAGGKANPHRDPLLAKPVKLKDAEIKQLVSFLESLTSEEKLEKPTLPATGE